MQIITNCIRFLHARIFEEYCFRIHEKYKSSTYRKSHSRAKGQDVWALGFCGKNMFMFQIFNIMFKDIFIDLIFFTPENFYAFFLIVLPKARCWKIVSTRHQNGPKVDLTTLGFIYYGWNIIIVIFAIQYSITKSFSLRPLLVIFHINLTFFT